MYNLIPELPPLRGLQESFYPFYVFHAVRKFMFFVPSKNGASLAPATRHHNAA